MALRVSDSRSTRFCAELSLFHCYGSLGIVTLAVWIIHLFAQYYRDVSLVGLAAALAMMILILLFEANAISLIFSGGLIGIAYWVYVRRLLTELPAIDQPMRWLSLRLSRDGVPSVRERVLEVWDQARQWVIARMNWWLNTADSAAL